MSKAHRGSELRREVPRSGRGTCPVTHKSGVKLLFDYDIDGTTTKISKYGKAILENRRLRKEKEAQRKARAASEKNQAAPAAGDAKTEQSPTASTGTEASSATEEQESSANKEAVDNE